MYFSTLEKNKPGLLNHQGLQKTTMVHGVISYAHPTRFFQQKFVHGWMNRPFPSASIFATPGNTSRDAIPGETRKPNQVPPILFGTPGMFNLEKKTSQNTILWGFIGEIFGFCFLVLKGLPIQHRMRTKHIQMQLRKSNNQAPFLPQSWFWPQITPPMSQDSSKFDLCNHF